MPRLVTSACLRCYQPYPREGSQGVVHSAAFGSIKYERSFFTLEQVWKQCKQILNGGKPKVLSLNTALVSSDFQDIQMSTMISNMLWFLFQLLCFAALPLVSNGFHPSRMKFFKAVAVGFSGLTVVVAGDCHTDHKANVDSMGENMERLVFRTGFSYSIAEKNWKKANSAHPIVTTIVVRLHEFRQQAKADCVSDSACSWCEAGVATQSKHFCWQVHNGALGLGLGMLWEYHGVDIWRERQVWMLQDPSMSFVELWPNIAHWLKRLNFAGICCAKCLLHQSAGWANGKWRKQKENKRMEAGNVFKKQSWISLRPHSCLLLFSPATASATAPSCSHVRRLPLALYELNLKKWFQIHDYRRNDLFAIISDISVFFLFFLWK